MYKNLLKSSISRFRMFLAVALILVGGLLIWLAFTLLAEYQTIYQTITAAIGSAMLGAGCLALYDAITFKLEIQEAFQKSNLKEVMREAFSSTNNLREDGIKLGVVRIFASRHEVVRQQSIGDLVGNAKIVYVLGTTAFTTSHFSDFLKSKPNTLFRFIFVDIPKEEGNQLEKALSIIHGVPIRGHLEQAKKILDDRKKALSNVDYRMIQFVPPFSAILALGETEEGEPWGRLQTDHYLLRTLPDTRLWLIINGPGSILFDRYSNLIEDIWQNHEKYDVRTADISL